MFEKSFEARVEKVLTKRVKDEDGGAVHLSMNLCMPLIDDDHLDELGGETRALVDARDNSEGARSVPFKSAPLDFVFKDVSLVVYGLSASDEKPKVKFQVDGCEATQLKLVRNDEDKTKVDLKWKVLVPPLKQRDQALLIEATGADLRLALTYRQQSLNV
ncbi:MAG: hypothetical protein U9Q07_03835 [Planctomycetota bacterium]|nr:hypothetical protein [Planctomycetota bacterium]